MAQLTMFLTKLTVSAPSAASDPACQRCAGGRETARPSGEEAKRRDQGSMQVTPTLGRYMAQHRGYRRLLHYGEEQAVEHGEVVESVCLVEKDLTRPKIPA